MFNENVIKEIEKTYNASYVGIYDWTGSGVMGAVFYQPYPNRTKGHTKYFAIFRDPLSEGVVITNAEKIEDRHYPAIKFGEDDYLVSRGRYDMVTRGEAMLDGGGAGYYRCHPDHPPTHTMRVVEGKEVFREMQQ